MTHFTIPKLTAKLWSSKQCGAGWRQIHRPMKWEWEFRTAKRWKQPKWPSTGWVKSELELHNGKLFSYETGNKFMLQDQLKKKRSVHSVVSDSLRPHGRRHTRPPCPSPTPRVYSNSCPSSWWCHPTISSSVVPFSCLSISQHQGLFKWVISSQEVAKVLEFQLQHQSFQWTPRTDLL